MLAGAVRGLADGASAASTASAISAWLKPKTSFSTNTARSSGLSVSSTTSSAIDTESASVAVSGRVPASVQDRLGQPRADVRLAPAGRPQPVHAPR